MLYIQFYVHLPRTVLLRTFIRVRLPFLELRGLAKSNSTQRTPPYSEHIFGLHHVRYSEV